jgi:protein transport protein SEC61 subunit gamma-like protein
MADEIQNLLDAPLEFWRDGLQFVRRCEKRKATPDWAMPFRARNTNACQTADRKEFIKICTAVGTGFVVMGVVGYFVKLGMNFLPSSCRGFIS